MAEEEEEEQKVVEQKPVDDKEYIPNPKELDGAPDLSMLVYLEMRHVLHNLEYRFCKMPSKNCYTSISTILVAINPYERLPIYGQDVIDEVHNEAKKGRLPQNRPHPYGVSARSYMRMVQRKLNQSVIVCGESGAGKTETTKLLMRYLAMTAPSVSMESSIVEQQIIAASPILEAYGNAKTVMNNNSSRFGKFTKLLYECADKAKEGKILGSYLETYLLEKSRVVFQALNERNYHIFYFMHAGLPKEKHNELHLSKADDFWYTNQGNSVEVPGVSDKDRFIELAESLKLMRIDEPLQEDLWRATAGILNLGNISFKKLGDGFADIDDKTKKYLDNTAELWGIDAAALKTRLTTATMKVMKKNIEKKITFDEASTNRDSIGKGLYEKVFLWLCARINAELFQMDAGDDDDDEKNDKPISDNLLFIGILDVFGFENFYINSLEQFCINFTNEKLQQFFNYHIILSEQEEYIKESVFWKPLSIPDNVECISMIEDSKNGFFIFLDSACQAPKPDHMAFIQELFKNHDKNKTLHRANQPGSGNARGAPKKSNKKGGQREKFDGFMIDHFADHVTYDAQNFLVKNMEAVHPDTAKMLQQSKTAMIQQLAEEKKAAAKKKLSVTGTFHKGIKTLMKNLKETEPFFVRCVNPNMVKSAKLWDEKVVEHQLRCGGLVEALKVLKLGYPTRVPYSTLYDSYHHSVTNPLIKNMGPESFSTALLIAFDVNEGDYELGLTKIFFKPSKAAILDTIMAQAGKPLTHEQSEKITKWVVQKRLKQMVGICKSFLELRKRIRLGRAANLWRYIGRVTGFVGFSALRHLKKARNVILERKRNASAKLIQSFFRGTYETARYRNFISKVKKGTKSIWISYRRWNERKLLKQWLDVKVEETRKRKAEELKKQMEDETRRKAEEERLAKERKQLEELEKLREQARQEAEKKRLEEEKRKQEEEEREKELAKKRQEQASISNAVAKQEQERAEREAEKTKRENSIKVHVKKEKKVEEKRKAKAEETKLRKKFPELYQDEEEDGDENADKNEEEEDEDEEDSDSDKRGKKHSKKNGKKGGKKGGGKKGGKKNGKNGKKNGKKVKETKKVKKNGKKKEKNEDDEEAANHDDVKEEDEVKNEDEEQGSVDVDKEKDEDEPDEDEDRDEDDEDEDEDDEDNENENDEDEDSEESDKPPAQTLAQQLKQFPKIAATGQLFLKYTGKRRRKPQDRIVKVSFDSEGQPKQISWGSGSRHIDFSDILYIAQGHYTPVFLARKDQLDPDLCFSVVGKTQILDVQASTKSLCELWVKGLRRLIGQTDADAMKLAKQNMEGGNLPGATNTVKKDENQVKDHKKRTKSLMLLQQDLFVMTTTTVFRNLEEERIWEIDQSVRDRFNAKMLYEEALRQDVPWRQWNHWIREKIVTYLRENNRVAHQGVINNNGGGANGVASYLNVPFNGDFTAPMTPPSYNAPPNNNNNNNLPSNLNKMSSNNNLNVNPKPHVNQGGNGAQQDESCTLM